MTIPPEPVRRYVLIGLGAMPSAFAALLMDASEAEIDARPYPDRFTLREMTAHLADWDAIWLDRVQKIVSLDNPDLPDCDEERLVIDHDYAHAKVADQLLRYTRGRLAMITFLASIDAGSWARTGNRGGNRGEVSLFYIAAEALGHDGYHLNQVLRYRGAAP